MHNKNKPNVIFILADDMGYGDFGKFSDGMAETPCLDQMLEGSTCLTHHYSAAPVCTPARAALLTGRYNHRTGAIDMRELRGLSALGPNELTIADIFKASGYVTGLVGKWHNGTIGKRYHPNARGFEEFIGFRGGLSDYYDWNLYFNDTIKKSDGRYLTEVFTEEAIKFIRRNKNRPFFLHLAYNAPHAPLQAPEEEIIHFREKGLSEKLSTLYSMIYIMDRGIGQILEELHVLALEENTIVIFASDNGPAMYGGMARYNANLRGGKGGVFEGGIRVPGVVRWPERFKGGNVNDEFVHFTDWLPTLANACNVKIPENLRLDGKNVLGILDGTESGMPVKRFWQWNRYTPVVASNAAVRDGVWKLVRPAIPETMKTSQEDANLDRIVEKNPENYTAFDTGLEPERIIPEPPEPMLFNLEEDPGETTDLSSQYPEMVKALQNEIECWFMDVERDRRQVVKEI